MATPHFNLKDKTSEPSHIIMRYRYTKIHYLKYYTNQHINPKHFSTRSLVSRSNKLSSTINRYLEHLRTIALEVNNEMRIKGTILSTDDFKKEIDIKLGLISISSTWYDHAIKVYNEKVRLKLGDKEKVRYFLNKVDKIHSHIGDVSLDQLSRKYFKKIVAEEYEVGNEPTYINKLLQITKQICKDAEVDQEVHPDYKHFKQLKARAKDTIYNTLEEVEAIYNYDYGDKEHLRNTANIYIIGCFTALRVSDYMKVAKNPADFIVNIEGIDMIKVKASQKTKTPTIIKLHPIIKHMLDNYTIRKVSTQKLNDNLKVIGKLIGMDQPFKRLEWPGGVETEVTYKRYELLSSHCARRSFVSIMWDMGVNARTIMQFTGHKSEQQLMKYMRLTGETTAIDMADHPFFQSRPKLRKAK